MNKFTTLPTYSLYDLYMDIMRGRKSEFTYQGQTYQVKMIKAFIYQVIDSNGLTYTMPRPTCMFDLQAAATNLNYYKCSLIEKNNELFTTDLNPIQ